MEMYEQTKKRLSIDVSPEQHKALKVEAAKQGISISDLVLNAVKDKYK